MIKHRPDNKTGIEIDGKIYRCNRLTGIVELPIRIERFNPIEKAVKVKKKETIED